MVNDEIAYKKIYCTNAVKLRNTENCLHKIRCKWEKKSGIFNFSWGGGENITAEIRMNMCS
jgi:hypothetical protein